MNFLARSSALAFVVLVSIPEATGQVLNPANGHWYEGVLVTSPLDWNQAQALAASATFMNMPGHLATISDQSENSFVDGASPDRMWIGGFQDASDPNFSEPAGGWKWATGEPMAYTNWHPNEPSNSGNNEHHLIMHQNGFNGTWNDEGQTQIFAYMIEYEPVATYCTPANPNSTGVPASMSSSGTSLLANNDLVLVASDLPLSSFGLFLTSQTQGFVANPGSSQGNLCLGGAIGRFVGPGQIQNSGSTGVISLAVDLAQHPTPMGLVAVASGETWNYQAWYRDAVGGTATSNFTDGLSLTFL